MLTVRLYRGGRIEEEAVRSAGLALNERRGGRVARPSAVAADGSGQPQTGQWLFQPELLAIAIDTKALARPL